MRKLTILLAVAALTTTVGCGRCRSLFSKGSPCGTAIAAHARGIAAITGPPTALAPASTAAAAISSPAARNPAGRISARRAST